MCRVGEAMSVREGTESGKVCGEVDRTGNRSDGVEGFAFGGKGGRMMIRPYSSSRSRLDGSLMSPESLALRTDFAVCFAL